MGPVAEKTFTNRLRMRHIELFEKVCELQSLRKAAVACNMTQPAATKLIQELEDMFAVRLFHRSKQGMTLSYYGETVMRHASTLMADVGHMQREITLISRGAVGHIRLGIIPSLSPDLLASSIATTIARYPGVRITIEEGLTTELISRLLRNELDLAFGRILDLETAKNLRVTNVYDEKFSVVCRAGHPLADMPNADWSILASQPWILPPSGSPMRALVDNLFTQHSVLRPSIAVECNAFDKSRQLIAQTDMLGVVPSSLVLPGNGGNEGSSKGSNKGNNELAVLRPTLGFNFAPISLISRRQAEQVPVAKEFVKTVQHTATLLGLG